MSRIYTYYEAHNETEEVGKFGVLLDAVEAIKDEEHSEIYKVTLTGTRQASKLNEDRTLVYRI